MKKISESSIQVEDVYKDDYPKFCDAYMSYAEWEDGTELTEKELEKATEDYPELVNEAAHESLR